MKVIDKLLKADSNPHVAKLHYHGEDKDGNYYYQVMEHCRTINL